MHVLNDFIEFQPQQLNQLQQRRNQPQVWKSDSNCSLSSWLFRSLMKLFVWFGVASQNF